MSLNHKNNRLVKCIYISNNEIRSGLNSGITLMFESAYHGDRDEHWILEIVAGKEIARHNVRYIETIIWYENDSMDS